MKTRILTLATSLVLLAGCSPFHSFLGHFTIREGETGSAGLDIENFRICGQAMTQAGSSASIMFHSDGTSGYEVLFHNGPQDGSIKTGSLHHVRNLYRSLTEDGQWCNFEISVRGKNIFVAINGTPVVCYTEPSDPYRSEEHKDCLLSKGDIFIKGISGKTQFRNTVIEELSAEETNPGDTLPPVGETYNRIIRLQQEDFPVIDWHVHLKGGLTKEMAHAMSMNYGINYGVAPNAGEGGVGRMLRNDEEVYEYYNEVAPLPFLFGVQGEGRRWTLDFSKEALGTFDYLFTDAMTIVDHKGRNARIYRPEEVIMDGISKDEYMDVIVDQTVTILTNEPADIFANATYIPDEMNADYDVYWTQERIDKVLDVLEKNQIALEINARYRIPSFNIIRQAKQRGIKFTFGTNNVDADFGKLEYCFAAIDSCGLTRDDMWFPSMSVRSSRTAIPGSWKHSEVELIDDSLEVMRVLTVVSPDDLKILRKESAYLGPADILSDRYDTLAARLISTVTSPDQGGVGIAGVQVGINRRIIAVQRFDKEGEPFEVYPNIEIIAHRGGKKCGAEGCLSVPGQRGNVPRWQDIDIKYVSPVSLKDTVETVQGFTAVIFQHETDHLEGTLYTDHL